MTDATLFAAGALFTQDYLEEGITQSQAWAATDAGALRETLATILVGFPHASNPNEATTESDFVWPVLQALGWSDFLTQQNLSDKGRVDVPDGLLFIDAEAKAKANEHAEEVKRYEFGAAIVESKRWGRALDRAEGRKGTDRDTPSTQLLRYLRRVDDLTRGALRWGILTNGARWRLYFAGARSTIDEYLEIDLARIMGLDGDLLDTGITDAERDHWLRVFAALFHRSAFERATADAPNFLERARKEAAFYEERVAKSLSDLVFDRLYPTLGKAVAKAAPADTPLDDIRQATLILLYRLLFVLYAEDRGLLPVKDRRFDDYALRVARLDIGRRKDEGDAFSTIADTIWRRFASLAKMIDKGDPSVGLPPYNGGLFSGEATPLLATLSLGDDVMAEALDILSWEQRGGRRRYINYRDLSVQQLGSIYERLLEFELVRDDTGALEIRPNIFARKNSGSYYTPDDLVLLILDETLAPLIEDAHKAFRDRLASLKPADSEDYKFSELQKVDPAKAITRLRVCDLANMGEDPGWILEGSGVSHDQIRALVPIDAARMAALFDLLATRTRSGSGIRCGLSTELQDYSIAGYAVAARTTVREAISAWIKYSLVAGHPLLASFKEIDERWIYRVRPRFPLSAPALRFCFEATLSGVAPALTKAGGGALRIFEYWFPFQKPADAAIYDQLAPAAVCLDTEEAAIVGSIAELDRIMETYDSDAGSIFDTRCEQLMGSIQGSKSRAEQLTEIFASASGQLPSLDDAEAALGVSSRTLHRELAAQGQSFQKTLDAYRRDFTFEHLDRGHSDVKKIAHALGFADPGSFHRVFRRWTGVTVKDWLRVRRNRIAEVGN